jgi:hypothetical protein
VLACGVLTKADECSWEESTPSGSLGLAGEYDGGYDGLRCYAKRWAKQRSISECRCPNVAWKSRRGYAGCNLGDLPPGVGYRFGQHGADKAATAGDCCARAAFNG